jgi:hypothetical protein
VLVLIDDGATDETRGVAAAQAAADPRVPGPDSIRPESRRGIDAEAAPACHGVRPRSTIPCN